MHYAGRATSKGGILPNIQLLATPAFLLQTTCTGKTPTLGPCPRRRRLFRPKVREIVCVALCSVQVLRVSCPLACLPAIRNHPGALQYSRYPCHTLRPKSLPLQA